MSLHGLTVIYLLRWTATRNNKATDSKSFKILVVPDGLAEVSKIPCTKLKISDNGRYLAVGASDGAVSVLATEKLRKV